MTVSPGARKKGGLQLEAFTDLLPGAQEAERIVMIDLVDLYDSPVQVREPFDPEGNESDASLLENIRSRFEKDGVGIIQPLLVRLKAEGGYEIIEGHRRKRAAERIDGMRQVPCIVVTADEAEAAVQTGIANIQRRQLTPLEEGRQYLTIARLRGESVRQVALRLGQPVRTAQQRVQLTKLPTRVQELLQGGALSINQALSCQDEAWGGQVAEIAAERGLGPGDIENVVAHLQANPDTTPGEAVETVVGSRPVEEAPQKQRRRKPAKPKVDYQAIVRELDVGLSDEQAGLLVEFARAEELDRVGVRWAALVLSSSELMTPSAATAYASQLVDARVGSALRALYSALERLERRSSDRRHLTPNLVTAAQEVIKDVRLRLGQAAENMERTVDSPDAAAASEGEE
jgi:ParB/RepB/Spo0J family partition protein